MKGNRPDDSTCIRRDKVVYTRRAYLAIRRSRPFLLPSSSSPHCPFLPISQHRSRHRDKGRRGELVGGCVYALADSSSRLVVPVFQPIGRSSRFFVHVDKPAFLVTRGNLLAGGVCSLAFRASRKGSNDGKFSLSLSLPPFLFEQVINVVMRNAHVGVY